MRIALIGASGQLGTDLLTRLQAADHDVVPLSHAQIEITDESRVHSVLESLRPELAINTAAYNFVDKAEAEPDITFAANALGPRNIARVCEHLRAAVMHISTDYVFGADESRARPYQETDATGPISVYGQCKLAGEFFVRAECERHFVVRTCGLYGLAAMRDVGKGNFVETMLKLGNSRNQLRVVNDQRCTPTSTADLAEALTQLLPTQSFGLYHATNSGDMTWCEFAREIFQSSNLPVDVQPITTAEFGAKAHRPAFSVLDCGKLSSVISHSMPDWHDALARYLASRETELAKRAAEGVRREIAK